MQQGDPEALPGGLDLGLRAPLHALLQVDSHVDWGNAEFHSASWSSQSFPQIKINLVLIWPCFLHLGE